MAHFIQPITIDGTAYCCKCYGVSALLGRGTKGVLTDSPSGLDGETQTAVITNDCSPWTLLTGELADDTWELWWGLVDPGDMDDTMKYTHGGVDYFANAINKFPLFAPEDFVTPTANDDIYDPWQATGGVVTARAFRKILTTDAPATTYGVSYETYDGATLTITQPHGPAPALGALTIQNWVSTSGGDTTNHYWNRTTNGGVEGELSFGVSCGTNVEVELTATASGGTGTNGYSVAGDIGGETIALSSSTGATQTQTVNITVTGGPCGSIVQGYAFVDVVGHTDDSTTVTVTAEVIAIT